MVNIHDFIVNPNTNKLVKIGSKKYKQLVKDKVLKMKYSTRAKNVVYNGANAKEVKKNLVPEDNIVLVAKDDKIYKQRRQFKNTELIDEIIDNAYDLIKNDLDDIDFDNTDDDELRRIVRQMIYQKSVGSAP